MQGVALADLDTALGHLLVVSLNEFQFFHMLFDALQADEFFQFTFSSLQYPPGFLSLLSFAQVLDGGARVWVPAVATCCDHFGGGHCRAVGVVIECGGGIWAQLAVNAGSVEFLPRGRFITQCSLA